MRRIYSDSERLEHRANLVEHNRKARSCVRLEGAYFFRSLLNDDADDVEETAALVRDPDDVRGFATARVSTRFWARTRRRRAGSNPNRRCSRARGFRQLTKPRTAARPGRASDEAASVGSNDAASAEETERAREERRDWDSSFRLHQNR